MATQVLAEPVSTFYTVDFSSGGDTTNQAFGKHIQEIEKIYGILNALNADKVSASDVSGLTGSVSNLSTALTNHINSTTDPHPYWKPSVSWSDLTGTKPNLADFSGNVPTSRITGLQEFVEDLIPEDGGGSDKGDGITSSSLAQNGYAKFNNGLIIQWGRSEAHTPSSRSYMETFPTSFSTACYAVIPTGKFPNSTNDLEIQLVGWNTTGYSISITGSQSMATAFIYFLAIGV